ncbi:hypothetical protein [Catalinimonas locisalis]
MANQRIEMRKIKRLFKLYTEGVSKRTISVRIRPAVYILFLKF